MVVSEEAATGELNKWLDFQDIPEKQRVELKANIEILISAICNGKLIINDDNSLTQKLKHPFGEQIKISELKYRSTPITVGEVDQFKSGIAQDVDNRSMLANVCAATGQLYSVLSKMSSKDYNLSAAVIIFFMV